MGHSSHWSIEVVLLPLSVEAGEGLGWPSSQRFRISGFNSFIGPGQILPSIQPT